VRGALAYATAKAAVEGLTRAAAVDHGSAGVRVNAVALGSIETERYRSLLRHQTPQDVARTQCQMAELHPLRQNRPPRRGRRHRGIPPIRPRQLRHRHRDPDRRRPRGSRPRSRTGLIRPTGLACQSSADVFDALFARCPADLDRPRHDPQMTRRDRTYRAVPLAPLSRRPRTRIGNREADTRDNDGARIAIVIRVIEDHRAASRS
jgi:Enoyl-(Acyl carrier protein) reductase